MMHRFTSHRVFSVLVIGVGLLGFAGSVQRTEGQFFGKESTKQSTPTATSTTIQPAASGTSATSSSSLTTPVLTHIWPPAGGIGQYITIEGSDFGLAPGGISFIQHSIPIPADTRFQDKCQSLYWRNSYVMVKVPQGAIPGQYTLRMKRSDGKQSNDIKFTVTSSSPSPGICGVLPDNGVPGTEVTLYGEGFGVEKGRVVAGSAEFLLREDNGWDTREIHATTPVADFVSGKFRVISSTRVLSNPALFTVGRCSKNACGDGQACCSDGTCRPKGLCVEKAALCQYTWSFYTGTLGKSGDTCADNASCASGVCGPEKTCIRGAKGENDACKYDSECTEGLSCTKGICRAIFKKIGQKCSAPAECLSGVCKNGLCVAGIKKLGERCAFHEQCSTSNCRNGVCAQSIRCVQTLSIEPRPGEIHTNSVFRVLFNQQVDHASIAPNFSIEPGIKGSLEIKTVDSGDSAKTQVIYRPTQDLSQKVKYAVTLGPGIKAQFSDNTLARCVNPGTGNTPSARCAIGTTRCLDGSCRATCPPDLVPRCNNNRVCEKSESCLCGDCSAKQDSCQTGAACYTKSGVCQNINAWPPGEACPAGTRRCGNGSCKTSCGASEGGDTREVPNGKCDSFESCAAKDCQNKQDSCAMGLLCSYDLKQCVESPATAPCKTGTTLCGDGLCRIAGTCPAVSCNKNNICEPQRNEGCTCSDCTGSSASCESGNACDLKTGSCKILTCKTGEQVCTDGNSRAYCAQSCSVRGGDVSVKAPCPNGWRLCGDKMCYRLSSRQDCPVPPGEAQCNDNGACELYEGCACGDCARQQDTCAVGLGCRLEAKMCTLLSCGNGKRDTGEECDDANTNDADACLSNCTVPKTSIGPLPFPCLAGWRLCGVGAAKACYRLTTSQVCPIPPGEAACVKNNICEEGEGCSCTDCQGQQDSCDANLICRTNARMCAASRCGNGIKDDREECDDGNLIDTDSCSNACKVQTSTVTKPFDPPCPIGTRLCADNKCYTLLSGQSCPQPPGESKCSPNNKCDPFESCSCADCRDRQDSCAAGLLCRPVANICVAPKCGNDIVESGEACDDGNTIDTDACLSSCKKPDSGLGGSEYSSLAKISVRVNDRVLSDDTFTCVREQGCADDKNAWLTGNQHLYEISVLDSKNQPSEDIGSVRWSIEGTGVVFHWSYDQDGSTSLVDDRTVRRVFLTAQPFNTPGGKIHIFVGNKDASKTIQTEVGYHVVLGEGITPPLPAHPLTQVAVTRQGSATQLNDDLFTCAKTTGCEGDSETKAGNQRKYVAQAYSSSTPINDNGIQWAWVSGGQTLTLTGGANTPVAEVTPVSTNGKSTLSVTAKYGATTAAKTLSIENTLCDLPWDNAGLLQMDFDTRISYCRGNEAKITYPSISILQSQTPNRNLGPFTREYIFEITADPPTGVSKSQCGVDEDCQMNMLCERGVCANGCRSDSRCMAGLVCREGSCHPNTDAIVMRVAPNPLFLSPVDWYTVQQFSGAPRSTLINGFPAVQDAYGAYVEMATINPNTKQATPYIVYISYNTNANAQTASLFQAILLKIEFTRSVPYRFGSDVQFAPDNFGAQLRRDLVRISDLNRMRALFQDRAPLLESGSYFSGQSISAWPSWHGRLSNDIGRPLPVDPYQLATTTSPFDNCTSFDPATCWNGQQNQFAFGGSVMGALLSGATTSRSAAHVYTYSSVSGGYRVCANMEYIRQLPAQNDRTYCVTNR